MIIPREFTNFFAFYSTKVRIRQDSTIEISQVSVHGVYFRGVRCPERCLPRSRQETPLYQEFGYNEFVCTGQSAYQLGEDDRHEAVY